MALTGSHSLILAANGGPSEQNHLPRPKPAFIIKLNSELLTRLSAQPQTGKSSRNNPTIDIGSDPAIMFGSQRTSLDRSLEDAPHEIFCRNSIDSSDTNPSSLDFVQNVTGRLSVRNGTEVDRSDAQSRLRSRTAIDRQKKKENTTITIDTPTTGKKGAGARSRKAEQVPKAKPPSSLSRQSSAQNRTTSQPPRPADTTPPISPQAVSGGAPRPQHGTKKLPPLPGANAPNSATSAPSSNTSASSPNADGRSNRYPSPESITSSSKSSPAPSLSNSIHADDSSGASNLVTPPTSIFSSMPKISDATETAPEVSLDIGAVTSQSISGKRKRGDNEHEEAEKEEKIAPTESHSHKEKLRLPSQYSSQNVLSSEEPKRTAPSSSSDDEPLAQKAGIRETKSSSSQPAKVDQRSIAESNSIRSLKVPRHSPKVPASDEAGKAAPSAGRPKRRGRPKKNAREIAWYTSSSDGEAPECPEEPGTSETQSKDQLYSSIVQEILKAPSLADYRKLEEKYHKDAQEWNRRRTRLSEERDRLLRLITNGQDSMYDNSNTGKGLGLSVDDPTGERLLRDIEECRSMFNDLCARRGAFVTWQLSHQDLCK